MPPKPKFCREEVVKTALRLVSEKGIECLTARELAKTLNSSPRPIFTLFDGMEQLQAEVVALAMKEFESFHVDGVENMPIFKQVGVKMVCFGAKEPKLFQLIFMKENERATTFDEFFTRLGDTAVNCIKTIKEEYGLDEKQAKILFEHTWIHTFGIGTLCATKTFEFSLEKISQMLTQDFTAMITFLKGNNGLK